MVDAANIPAGNQGRFRVWASDGIHTASDASDGTFTVPNRIPTVRITRPTGLSAVVAGQTLDLGAAAYDVDSGNMTGSQVVWLSSLDGILGQGDSLQVASLSQGLHTITVRADDGVGGVATDTVQVVVVSDPTQLPPPPPGSTRRARERSSGAGPWYGDGARLRCQPGRDADAWLARHGRARRGCT